MIYSRSDIRPVPPLAIFSLGVPDLGEYFPTRANARIPDPINPASDFTSETDDDSTDISPVADFPGHPPVATKTLVSGTIVTHFHPSIAMFNADWLPTPDKPDSYEDNWVLSSFRPIKSVWLENNERVHFNIPDATAHADQIHRAMLEPFHLSGAIPLPAEITESRKSLSANSYASISDFRGNQLLSIERPISSCGDSQQLWNSLAIQAVREASAGIQTVALTQLMLHLGLGGDRWLKQFTYGFSIAGTLAGGPCPIGSGCVASRSTCRGNF